MRGRSAGGGLSACRGAAAGALPRTPGYFGKKEARQSGRAGEGP
ncbi:hypothetical protein SAMN04244567_02894, partial [Paracoccus pantotrophus]